MNQLEQLLGDVLSCAERAKIQKSANVDVRREILSLTKRARALPSSNTVSFRKICVDPPAGCADSWGMLKMALESRGLKCV